MYVFGFIVAATLGCTAGSIDLTEGMFRHLVVTGRSRLALYLARIPAGLAIIVPLVAVGFTIVCTVCVVRRPDQLNYDGTNVPAGLSLTGLETWAGDHPDDRHLQLPLQAATAPVESSPAANGPGRRPRRSLSSSGPRGSGVPGPATPAQIRAAGRPDRPGQDYADYKPIVPVPVQLADDQDRVVARARSRHRVHRRPRARHRSSGSGRSR